MDCKTYLKRLSAMYMCDPSKNKVTALLSGNLTMQIGEEKYE